MEQEKIDRINALARKAKSEGLTLAEKQEQKQLREEYIALFRRNVKRQLENIVYVDEEGNETVLKKKVTVERIHLEHFHS